jgi:hypothetical protein
VSGTVVDSTTALPLSGAVITSGTASTTTKADGSFTLAGLPVGDGKVLALQATDHAKGVVTVAVAANATTFVYPRLTPVSVTKTFDPTLPATVPVPNSSAQVVLPAAGLIGSDGLAPSGNVTAAISVFDPKADASNMPGNYTAIPSGGGAAQTIESFGAIDVTLKDASGKPVNLAPRKTATIRIPLSTRTANPPAQVPLYYLDDATGQWIEQGTALLSGSAPNQYYEGTVSHFTAWNSDQPMSTIIVRGCVQDDKGIAVPGLEVDSIGADYTGKSTTLTAADGKFSVPIRRGGVANVFAQLGVRTTNAVTVGPSQVDIQLPTCLVLAADGVAPQFVEHPTGQAVHIDESVNLSVMAIGSPVLRYQWQLNGNPIADSNQSYLTFPSVQVADQGDYTVTATNTFGTVTSHVATLTVDPNPLPPLILGQPQPQSVRVGATATFQVVGQAQGGSLSYQWLRGSTPITGATGISYTTPVTTLADNGATFSVVLSSTIGTSVTSQAALLTVTQVTALAIGTQPQNASVQVGQSAGFSVSTSGGTVAPTYQWRLNGSPILGANSVSYTTPPTALTNSGDRYSVVVTSGGESVTSNDATLTVTAASTGSSYFLLGSAGPMTQSNITYVNGTQIATSPALVAVNTASPGSGTTTLVADGLATFPFGVGIEGTAASGQFTQVHSRVAAYFKLTGNLFKVDQLVANGAAPVAQQVSTLTSTEVCGSGGFPSLDDFGSGNDFANANHGWLFFRSPGADNNCFNADDVFRAVRMDMLPTDVAFTVGEPLAAIRGADGAFAGVIVRNGSQVQLLDANLGNPTNLFTLDSASFSNLGNHFGPQAGVWMFAEKGQLWGVQLSTPGTRVALTTLAAGEVISNASASDGISNFVAINSATSARVLSISAALSASTLLTTGAPVQQLALTPTRLVVMTSASTVITLPKAGGTSTPLGSFTGATPGSIVVAGENVYVSEFTIGASGPTPSTFIVASDGSNPVTLVNTSMIRGIAPPSYTLTSASANTNSAVLLADGVTGFGILAGATLRVVDGSTRNTLVTYGAFATDGVPSPLLTPDPLQFGQPGLMSVLGTTATTTLVDLYYYKSDTAGLVRVTSNITPAAVRGQPRSALGIPRLPAAPLAVKPGQLSSRSPTLR